jgi:hypothetical protein
MSSCVSGKRRKIALASTCEQECRICSSGDISFIIGQKLNYRRQESVKPESIPDSRAPDRTKPLNLTMGARGHLPEPNILMKVGQDIYTPAISIVSL